MSVKRMFIYAIPSFLKLAYSTCLVAACPKTFVCVQSNLGRCCWCVLLEESYGHVD